MELSLRVPACFCAQRGCPVRCSRISQQLALERRSQSLRAVIRIQGGRCAVFSGAPQSLRHFFSKVCRALVRLTFSVSFVCLHFLCTPFSLATPLLVWVRVLISQFNAFVGGRLLTVTAAFEAGPAGLVYVGRQ